jgi:ribose 5-phosphate isomerase A
VSSESEKKAVGEAAALLADGVATLGLGTGSTVTYLLHALAARGCKARCVATSVATEELGRSLGLFIEPFDALSQLDLAIDGADQIDPDFWVIKGGGGAHTREKIVANAAQRFVVIADHSKMVEKLSSPLPLEIFSFGLEATLAHIRKIGPVTLREVSKSPDGGVIADYHGTLENPYALGALLHAIPGVVDHGLFAPSLISDVLVAQGEKVTRLTH